MLKGSSMASRCYSCHSNRESDLHIFFFCSKAQQLWSWLLSLLGSPLPLPPSPSSFWIVLIKGVDANGRKSATLIFFQAIYTLRFLRNEAKHRSKKPNLVKAQKVFIDSCNGMTCSSSCVAPPSYPIFRSLGWGN